MTLERLTTKQRCKGVLTAVHLGGISCVPADGLQLGLLFFASWLAGLVVLATHKTRPRGRQKRVLWYPPVSTSTSGLCQGTRHMHVCIRSLEATSCFDHWSRPWPSLLRFSHPGVGTWQPRSCSFNFGSPPPDA